MTTAIAQHTITSNTQYDNRRWHGHGYDLKKNHIEKFPNANVLFCSDYVMALTSDFGEAAHSLSFGSFASVPLSVFSD